MFPLLMADKIGDYIIGTVVETIETEKLIGEFGQIILNDVYTNATPTADVAQKLQASMKEKGVEINTIEVENVYNETEASKKNVASWGTAENLKKGREAVTPVSSLRLWHVFTRMTLMEYLFPQLQRLLHHGCKPSLLQGTRIQVTQ